MARKDKVAKKLDDIDHQVRFTLDAMLEVRDVDAKAITSLTVMVAVGSALLGAGFGGLFSYWYSIENPNPIIAFSYVVTILAALILVLFVTPLVVNRQRAILNSKAMWSVIEEAYKRGMLDDILKAQGWDPKTPRPPFPEYPNVYAKNFGIGDK